MYENEKYPCKLKRCIVLTVCSCVEAEKYLFSLKEILATEAQSQSVLYSQVLWGLLACEILNQKSRETTEFTTVRRIKEMFKVRFSEKPMDMLHQTSWLLHWCAVFSFSAEKSNGLFAALLADRANFGDAYLNVIQLKNPNLMRHMISSFLLGRSQYQPQPQASAQTSRTQISSLPKNTLEQIALPIVLAEQDVYSDSFTRFLVALLEDYDFDEALKCAKELKIEAEDDILLRPHAGEIYRQACLYIYEVEARLYKKGRDMARFCQELGIANEAEASEAVVQNLEDQGVVAQKYGGSIQIQGLHNDAAGKISSMTSELVKRTEELNKKIIDTAHAAKT